MWNGGLWQCWRQMSPAIGYGEGERFDASKGQRQGPGTFARVPANQPHFVWTENEDARWYEFISSGLPGIKFVSDTLLSSVFKNSRRRAQPIKGERSRSPWM